MKRRANSSFNGSVRSRTWILLAAIALMACGDGWEDLTLGELSAEEAEELCVELLGVHEPGRQDCPDKGAYYRFPDPTDPNVIERCVESLPRVLSEWPDCADVNVADYLECESRFLADPCAQQLPTGCRAASACGLRTYSATHVD